MPPYTSTSTNKTYYVGSVSLERCKWYLTALSLADQRLQSGALIELHHGQAEKYYRNVVQHSGDGKLAPPSADAQTSATELALGCEL